MKPLLPHLPANSRYIEPCAGDGALIKQLARAGHDCVGAFDIDPQESDCGVPIIKGDATKLEVEKHYYAADLIITNPAWTRAILHPIIFNLYWQLPTWLLFDADWAHTKQARPYMPLCRKIVPVGRVRWIEGSKNDGKDNVAWYFFAPAVPTQFLGRL